MKDIYNRQSVAEIAARLKRGYPGLDADGFAADILADLPDLGIMDRAARIAQAMRNHLPGDYPGQLALLLAALPENPDGGLEGYGGFLWLPWLNFVGRYGLDHPEGSLDALGRMTLHFSGEFDIRPHIEAHYDLAMQHVSRWAQSPHWQQRRLASEGIRPRLPWGMRLKTFVADPAPVLAILDGLFDDKVESVRRSVANNLNDIAKDNPDQATAAAIRWWGQGGEAARWTVRHGLRTLIKQGNPEALALLGFAGGNSVEIGEFSASGQVIFGQSLDFAFALTSREQTEVQLSIDYAIHHRKANGKLAPKVFKLTKRAVAPGETIRIARSHAIRPITTRVYYPGQHQIEILVNGHSLGQCDFELVMEKN